MVACSDNIAAQVSSVYNMPPRAGHSGHCQKFQGPNADSLIGEIADSDDQ